jgi:hypothetical protein
MIQWEGIYKKMAEWLKGEEEQQAVLLESFPNRILAEMAAALLEAEGIGSLIESDDAGGAYPMLQFIHGVRLWVDGADEARAREILETPTEVEEEQSNS